MASKKNIYLEKETHSTRRSREVEVEMEMEMEMEETTSDYTVLH